MNYIEELFNKHPFIYFLDGKYYAFGNGVCAECRADSFGLLNKYREFEESVDENLTTKEAWRIFHGLAYVAEYVRDEKGFCAHPEKEFFSFCFEEKEMAELKYQIERHKEYWKKHEFNSYHR